MKRRPFALAVDSCSLALALCAQHQTTAELLRAAMRFFLVGNHVHGIEACQRALVALPDFSFTSESFDSARVCILRAIDLGKEGAA